MTGKQQMPLGTGKQLCPCSAESEQQAVRLPEDKELVVSPDADTDTRIHYHDSARRPQQERGCGRSSPLPSFVSPSRLNCLFSPLVFLLVLIFKFYFKLFKTLRMVQKANTT